MRYKVLKVFRDKYSKKLYAVGDSFTSEDSNRIEDLVKRKLIEGVSVIDTPSTIYTNMTKNEMMELLDQKGINYNKRLPKDDLIKLLQGGD